MEKSDPVSPRVKMSIAFLIYMRIRARARRSQQVSQPIFNFLWKVDKREIYFKYVLSYNSLEGYLKV